MNRPIAKIKSKSKKLIEKELNKINLILNNWNKKYNKNYSLKNKFKNENDMWYCKIYLDKNGEEKEKIN